MAGYYETKTFLRDEWEELQKGVESQLRTSYDQYLTRIGLKNEAEAIAKRKEEDAAGKKFGAQDTPFGVTGYVKPEERNVSKEYASALDTAQASNDAQAAKQIAALTGGRITGQEPVYQFGTPEFNKYMQDQIDQGKAPIPPDAYLDAQAFADRYITYSRLGTTQPTNLLWDDTKKEFYRSPSGFYDPKIEQPIVGMGTEWSKLNNAKYATLQQGVGSTAATDAAQYEIDKLFSAGLGYAPGSTIRDVQGVQGASSFKRDAAKEAAVIARGIVTKEELERRGGINAAGYYGDSYDPNTSLTDEEYAAAIAGKTGDEVGKAINAAVNAKTSKYNASIGNVSKASTPVDTTSATNKAARQSAYDLLYDEFDKYGLGSLVTPLKDLITSGVSPSQFTIELRNSPAYQKRFAANQARIKNGLRALSESEYIQNEDAYQDVMRRRGLPPEYYAKGDLGVQKGFDALLAGDVSSTELEDRIVTAQDRVLNANPEVAQALRAFYPGITNGDILAYALDPTNAINAIKRKVTAAEIQGAANQAGLNQITAASTPEQIKALEARASELSATGIDKEQAQKGFQIVADLAPRGGQLAAIYGESPYTQKTAEQEVFGLAGSTEARQQRKKIKSLEEASFSGRSGVAQGALARDRAGVI